MQVMRTSDQGDDAYMFDVLSSCSTHLGIRGLSRIAVSNKQLSHDCHAIIHRDALQLAEKALEASVAASRGIPLYNRIGQTTSAATATCWAIAFPAQARQLQDLLSLLQLAPSVAAAPSVVEGLMRVANVPNHMAVQFVEAGVRVSYAQLLGAASSMAEGVEVWPQAQHQLGITTDIPAEAVALCCDAFTKFTNRVEETLNLSAGDAADLRQLAMNSGNKFVRVAAARWLPPDLKPATAKSLLLTAAVRQCSSSIACLAGSAAVQQHTNACVLEEAISHVPDTRCKAQHQVVRAGSAKHELFKKFPLATAQMSTDVVVKLLNAAIEQRCPECTANLCSLPAAQQLSGEAVAALLAASLQHNNKPAADVFCDMPAAQQLSAGAVLQLLLAAMKLDSSEIAARLCRIAAAGQLTGETVVPLLEAAVKECRLDRLGYLFWLPAARQLSSSAAARLLIAVPLGYVSYIEAKPIFKKLPPDVLSGEVMAKLLKFAVARGNSVFVQGACQWPAARQLSSEVVGQLLQSADAYGDDSCGEPLRELLRVKHGEPPSAAPARADSTDVVGMEELFEGIFDF